MRNDGNNSISVTLELTTNGGTETKLAQFERTIAGFKSLASLKDELILAGSTELGQYFGKKFRKSADGDKLSQVKVYAVNAWIGKAQKGIKRGGEFIDLSAEEVKNGNGSSFVTVWKPTSGMGRELDIYLANPIFEVTEAKKEGYFLNLKLMLKAVNETSLEGVVIPLRVHLLE